MTPEAHILQVCNVGQIAGGTAACAWSMIQALPQCRHTVAFLSSVSEATRRTFWPHRVESWPQCTKDRIESLAPDLVILHNISPDQASRWEDVFTIQYVHSAGRRLVADQTVYCSQWLSRTCRGGDPSVLWQGVPRPVNAMFYDRHRNTRLKVGRLCTSTTRKWPAELSEFYAYLAKRHPGIDWEFVGCPLAMQPALQSACQGQAKFHEASWAARSYLWSWDAMLYHHPTLTESFGRTVAESARTGCLPIVDDRGGFSEQLQTLSLAGCRSWSDFSDELGALQDPLERQATSIRIRELADEQFSLHAFGQRVQALIQRLNP